jgi:hypothetical protein
MEFKEGDRVIGIVNSMKDIEGIITTTETDHPCWDCRVLFELESREINLYAVVFDSKKHKLMMKDKLAYLGYLEYTVQLLKEPDWE